ncbi:MAG TPA: hypothetical protein VHG08_04315 [Longimicrobium sp.]|nr:hypothetical protein [Longimicrobium sp.]
MDVSGDDCTASVLVYDRPPSRATADDRGTPFINDGCWGKRIFLGIDGERRELTRAQEQLPLGLGGAYSDGEYRVLVKRGRIVSRVELTANEEGWCGGDPGARVYDTAYEVEVHIWSWRESWRVDGALYDVECDPRAR